MNAKIVQKNNVEEQPMLVVEYPPEYKCRNQSKTLLSDLNDIKDIFIFFFHKLYSLTDNITLARSDYNFDDTKKKKLEECQRQWNQLTDYISNIQAQIENQTNLLLWCFRGNANGKFLYNYKMINETGFQSADNYDLLFSGTEVVPDALPIFLFEIQKLFLILPTCAIAAVKLQQDIISLFENDPLKREEFFKQELERLNKSIEATIKKEIQNQTEEIKESFAEQKKFKANKQKDLAKWIRSGIAKYCWKNKRTVKEKVRDGFKLPNDPTLIKMLNHWNRYLASSSEKREEMTQFEPYQKYSEILYAQEQTVKEWGEYTFAPTYIKKWIARKDEKEEKRRKKRKDGKKRPDALDRITVGGDDGEVVMDELVSKTKNADQVFCFDEPPPKKRRFRSS